MSHPCYCYCYCIPHQILFLALKNAQKNITLFPQSLAPSPQTLSSRPQIKKTHLPKTSQEVQEASGVEAPQPLQRRRVSVLRFNHSLNSSLPSKPVQEQGQPRSVFFLVPVLLPGELESRTGVAAGIGTL